MHARPETQLHGSRHRVGSRDHRLRRHHGGHGGQRHQRRQAPVGRHQEEGIADRLGIAQQQRALAEIAQRQRRHHHAEPGAADGGTAEVAHVGVQRLGAGQRQHHGAQQHEADPGKFNDEAQAPHGIERTEHFRRLPDPPAAQQRQRAEPQRHHRTEQLAHQASAATESRTGPPAPAAPAARPTRRAGAKRCRCPQAPTALKSPAIMLSP